MAFVQLICATCLQESFHPPAMPGKGDCLYGSKGAGLGAVTGAAHRCLEQGMRITLVC